jgi:hypothetical protein
MQLNLDRRPNPIGGRRPSANKKSDILGPQGHDGAVLREINPLYGDTFWQ